MLCYAFAAILISLVAGQGSITDVEYDYYDDELEELPMCGRKAKLDKSVIVKLVYHLNEVRYDTQDGRQHYGRFNMLPPALYMLNLGWNCTLEVEAIEAVRRECEGVGAFAPDNHTGLYYREDSFSRLTPSIFNAVEAWRKEIEEFWMPSHYIDRGNLTVNFLGYYHQRNFYNLVQADASMVGCAEVHCKRDDWKSYRVFCIMDTPPLKKGEIVYKIRAYK